MPRLPRDPNAEERIWPAAVVIATLVVAYMVVITVGIPGLIDGR